LTQFFHFSTYLSQGKLKETCRILLGGFFDYVFQLTIDDLTVGFYLAHQTG
jgi:hypothetical protein